MQVIRKLLIILLIPLVFCQCQTSSEIARYEQLPDELNTSIHKRIAKGIIPSIAIAIIDSTGIQYFNFGKTSKRGKEVDEHTIYEIGSISKVFTAILLSQQVRDGDLTLDDKINDYLPAEVKVPVMGEQEITFGNLSDHTPDCPECHTTLLQQTHTIHSPIIRLIRCMNSSQIISQFVKSVKNLNTLILLKGF